MGMSNNDQASQGRRGVTKKIAIVSAGLIFGSNQAANALDLPAPVDPPA